MTVDLAPMLHEALVRLTFGLAVIAAVVLVLLYVAGRR
jgi:hypothetical protein